MGLIYAFIGGLGIGIVGNIFEISPVYVFPAAFAFGFFASMIFEKGE